MRLIQKLIVALFFAGGIASVSAQDKAPMQFPLKRYSNGVNGICRDVARRVSTLPTLSVWTNATPEKKMKNLLKNLFYKKKPYICPQKYLSPL